MKKIDFTASDGKTIKIAEWKPEGEIKGILQISHGMAEHSGRYEGLSNFLTGKGFMIIADDHRAHGETDRETLGYCKGDIYSDTVRDMAEITAFYKKEYQVPVVLFGHSYGSFLTQGYIERYGDNIDGVIIGGSAKMDTIEVPFGLLVSTLLYGKEGRKPANLLANASFGSYNKKFKEGTFISSILEECERYSQDELCGFICSYNFYRYFFKGLKTLYKKENYSKINKELPILLISGENDPVGKMSKSVKALYEFYKSIGIKEVELKLYEGVRHEYLNDTSRQDAYNKIMEYLFKIVEKK